MNSDKVRELLRQVFEDDGFYSFEPAATTICIAVCEVFGIKLPWEGGPDPVGMWSDVPTPFVWDGEELVHAEPAGGGPCEKCLSG